MAQSWQEILGNFSGSQANTSSSKSSSSSSNKTSTKTVASQNTKSNDWQSILADLSGSRKQTYADYSTSVAERVIARANGKKKRSWFEKGLFEDGYDFGDISRTILGTTTDVLENVGSGIIGMGEKAVDAMAYIAPYAANGQFYQNGGIYTLEQQKQHEQVVEQSKKDLGKFIAKDLYDEEKIARAIISDPARKIGIDSETQSVFGEKSDALIQSGGQLLATAGLQAVGVPWFVTTGATSFGSEAENAMNQGATYEEAGASAAISAGAEILSEKLSGGISFGGKSLDDALTKQLARGISNKLGRTVAKLGLDMAGEGAEEVFSQIASNLGSSLYKEEDITELLFNEEAMEGYLESFIGGAALGGVSNTFHAVKSATNGVDYTSGLTQNEQKVVDKLYQDEIAKKEGKVTGKEKSKIYDSILEKMEKGDISTDTIEEVLGGEKYNQYKQAADWEASLQTEYDTLSKEFEDLGEKENPNLKDQSRYSELKEMLPGLKSKLDNVKATSTVGQQKAQLTNEVYELTKNDKLTESYNQRYQRGQKYEADVTQYDAKQQAVVQKAIDSGILNNSRRTHEFVDFIAKVSADKGVLFDFTNNAKLKESGFAVDGKQVNGFVTKDGITLNIDSAKAMNTTVGHEITHVLEGTEFYDSMKQTIFDYAKAKGEYQSRYDSIAEMYKDVQDADIEGELTADLVGDYLFSDPDFINNLSTQNRNVFQKIYDEVKYLCKVVTAGSKEARELERVKKAFEKAYREGGKTQSETKYSISEIVDENQTSYGTGVHLDSTLLDNLSPEDRLGMVKEYVKELGGESFTAYDPNGNPVDITIAKPTDKIKNHSGKRVPVNKDLTTKYIGNEVKQEAIALVDELIVTSEYKGSKPPKYPHGWVDNNGQNNWEYWKTYIQDKNNTIWEATLNVANSANGEKILYDISPIKKVGRSVKSDTLPTDNNVAQNSDNVKHSQPEGKQLTEEQNEHGLNREEEVSFSLSNDTAYMDKAIAMNASSLRVDSKTLEETKALRERIAARMNDIKDRGLVGLPEDIEGNTYIANSSYDGTEENTTICPRSLASEAFVDAVSEYLGRPLTVEEQIYISQDLQGRSLTPECTYCYVATDRKAYRAFLGEYVAQRDAVLQKVQENPSADLSRSGELYKEFLNGRKDTNPMYSRFKMWVDAYKHGKPMIDASHLANINKLMGDINSEFGAELKPQITDAMKYAQSASWAKKRVNYVAYNGHILKWKQDRINKLNSHYGLRMYSFSDFHPAFVLENMQMITDASVRGLKMLGYTKDTDFVDIFAPSGMNINISTFGFETGGNVFENNLIGAEWEKAKALRDQYPNVGITFVATNDTLVDWALDQDWIDVVIPFHLVRTGREVAKAFNYHDYTSESSDTKTKEWKKGDKKYIAPTEHNNDKATYLTALENNHLKPRFERFLENPNYMKLVNECRQPASMSKPVQPVFNEDAAKVALAKLEANGYYQPIGGSVDRMYEIAGEVAEAMTNELAPARSLSNVDEQHTSDSLSALRLETTDDIAPVAEESSVVAENATTTKEVEDVAPVDVSKSPVLKRLNQKLTNNMTELANVQKLREDSGRSFDEKIAKTKEQLDSKKDKDTKVANNLRRRIERLERLKADVDSEYAKRIGNIKSRITKTEADIQKYHPGLDRAEKAIARIDKKLEADKSELTEEYDLKREQLADKDSYISQKATELYNEIRKLKKGVRASEQLGYLLDHGYEWSAIKSALINIKHTPGETVNINSEAESVAREMLNESYENAQSDLEIEYLKQVNELEAKAAEKRKATSVANQRKAKMEEHTKRWEDLIGDTTTWKDMSLGLSYKTKTLRRILRKVVKDANGNSDIQKADAIYDELETKYDHNEAQLKQESKKLKEVFFELNLNHAEDTYANMLGELKYNPETTLTEEVVKEYYDKHKGKIDSDKVNKAIAEARKTFDGLLIRVNDVLREQGMKEIPYRKGYFPHFTNPKQGWLAKLLNWKTIDTEIPTSIAGLTEMFTPQRSWQSFNKQRMGDKTDYSLYQGLDTYIHGALDWIYHIDDLQSRRSLENYLRYTHSDEGIKQRIEEIKANDTYDAEETQKLIEGVLAEANNPLSGLVRELMNRTNTLANKKSSMDRSMEDATNRKIYSTMTNLNNRINANMVVGSFSSALTNFIPMVQSWHQVSPYFTVRGLGDFVRSTVKDDGMVAKSDFLTNRLVEEEKLYQTNWDKVSDKAAFMMNVIDNITSQTVWRSKYLQNIKEGMNETQAIRDADQFAKNLIAGRSRGNAPTIFDAKNPLAKVFTAFQLEVANQYGYMFEDVPQDSTNTARLVKGYATAFLGAYAYNALYSSLVGRDAAFDPIGIVEDLLKNLFDDDDEEENLGDELLGFGKNVLEEVPFVGGLVGGGRVPMSSAFPYSGYTTPFESMLNDVDNKNWDSLGKEFLKPLYYLAMPVGGGQIKKTVEGLRMFSDEHPIAGSYTTSGNLRFPVDDTFGSKLQAGLFGQYASENARKYFDQEQKPLYPEQTEIFAGLDIPIEEYWEYRDNLYEFYDVRDKLKDAAYADDATDEDVLRYTYINNTYGSIYDLYDMQKELAGSDSPSKKAKMRKLQNQMTQMLSDSKYAVDSMKLYGAYGEVGDKRYNKDADSGRWYEIKPKNSDGSDNWYYQKEQEVTKGLGISYEQYWNNREEYNYAYDKPGRYAIAQTVGGYDSYMEHYDVLENWQSDNYLSADKDAKGNSISGSRKKKVLEYIEGLDLDYGEKIILYRTVYSSKADKRAYNQDIIDYLNSRDDISYQDMKTILEELEMEVDSEGYITW